MSLVWCEKIQRKNLVRHFICRNTTQKQRTVHYECWMSTEWAVWRIGVLLAYRCANQRILLTFHWCDVVALLRFLLNFELNESCVLYLYSWDYVCLCVISMRKTVATWNSMITFEAKPIQSKTIHGPIWKEKNYEQMIWAPIMVHVPSDD